MEEQRPESLSGAKMDAKTVSLGAKIVAVVLVIALFVLKGFGVVSLEASDIVTMGVTIVALFADVSVNLFLEKIFKK